MTSDEEPAHYNENSSRLPRGPLVKYSMSLLDQRSPGIAIDLLLQKIIRTSARTQFQEQYDVFFRF